MYSSCNLLRIACIDRYCEVVFIAFDTKFFIFSDGIHAKRKINNNPRAWEVARKKFFFFLRNEMDECYG